ncbi:M56 family metallopeptidase [Terrisporobacter hibernicus]|uniref:M56 family metallopeptidase n=1 Tax=Terrisporobacter hibernicus TaxID=2813371 RepID=A0AAX2ZG09_9FIRM|nr:M56 family metallopeptidase [Terrisporobacter hibernicus]UEL47710.1 M56 family metallopeptidase [Terrisporobacter hibernicus]
MENIWGYIVGATIFGSATGLIILLIKTLLKNKINKRYAYLLWIILVIKLIIPFGPESNISLFNSIPINSNMENILSSNRGQLENNDTKLDDVNSNSNASQTNDYIEADNKTNEVNSTNSTSQDNYSSNEDYENVGQNSQVINNTASRPIVGTNKDKLSTILSYVWLFGLIFAIVGHMAIYIYFIKDLKKSSILKYERLEKILKNCKSQLNINKNIQVIVHDKINSPSLVGMFKVNIILPRHLINLSEEELTHIFLHELCHYKNKDNYIDNLLGVLQCVHWFNPLIHYYFKKMRNDMEIACDERVLSVLNEDEHNKYGITMLNVLEKINFNSKVRVGLNMANDKKTMRERVELIKNSKNFSNKKKIFTVTGIICLLVMGGVLLTNAKIIKVDDDLDKAISNVILEKYGSEYEKKHSGIYSGDGELSVEAHKILGKSTKNNKIEIYLIATYGDYEFQNNIFNLVKASLEIPLKITFTTDSTEGSKLKDNNKYYYVDMKMASDGSYLEKSIKDMFPRKEANKALDILNDTKESEKLLEEINQDATKYVEGLGRKSKVTYHYVQKENIDESALDIKEVGTYPDYIGTREVIENKKRYIYKTDYSKTTKMLNFTKKNENGQILEEISYEINNNKMEKIDSDKYISYREFSGNTFIYIDEAKTTFTAEEIKIVNNEAKIYGSVKNESDKDLHLSMKNITIGENTKNVDFEVTIGRGESQNNILTIKGISKISDLYNKHTGTILIKNMNNTDDVKKIDFLNKF